VNPQLEQVSNLINRLVEDEDVRQELWLHHLNTPDESSLGLHLQKISAEAELEHEVQVQLWFILKNPPSDKFFLLLGKLSPIEQSVVCLLALGLTVGQISLYKEIAEIRIRQVISVIKENSCWEQLYAEEKTNRG
jgi:hypothetical protein